MKPGDLVKIAPRPFLGRVEKIGMILDYNNEDLIQAAKVVVMGKITYVGKEYIKLIKNNTHAS